MRLLSITRRSLLAAPFALAARAADEFWTTKPADQWTVEECEKLLSKSPWAETMTVARGALVEGVNVASGRARRAVGGPVTVDLVIRWMSAQPMKQALARVVGPIRNPRAAKKAVFRDEAGYILIVKGVPLGVMQLSGETRASLERSAELRIPGRDPIKISRMGFARDGGGAEIRFVFPEAPNLTAADKSAELRFELGKATIKHKFNLEKMVYQGELAL
jgi:hypothetical protein